MSETLHYLQLKLVVLETGQLGRGLGVTSALINRLIFLQVKHNFMLLQLTVLICVLAVLNRNFLILKTIREQQIELQDCPVCNSMTLKGTKTRSRAECVWVGTRCSHEGNREIERVKIK